MSDITRYGRLTPGAKQLQPGASWVIEDDGIARRFETWRVNSADLFALMPQVQSAHPTYPNLTVKRAVPTDLAGGITEFQLEYSGLAGAGGATIPQDQLPPPVFSLERASQTEPISTHPRFQALIAAAGGVGTEKAVFDSSGIFQGFGRLSEDPKLVGVTDYLSFGVVFSVRRVTTSTPALGGVGFIGSPPAQAPSVSGPRNWLKIDASYEQEGFVFATREAWMLSGLGGWHPIIYNPG